MKKKYIILMLIAIIIDLSVFGSLLYYDYCLKKEIIELKTRITNLEYRNINQENILTEKSAQVSQLEESVGNIEKNSKIQSDEYYDAIQNLDPNIFVVDFDNYSNKSNEIKITENQAKQIAQKGFEESKRISSEGTDNIESQIIKIEEVNANNYFTRLYSEGDKVFTNIKRKCYVIQRENELGCGVSIYVDVNTGLIIGGEAFGD